MGTSPKVCQKTPFSLEKGKPERRKDIKCSQSRPLIIVHIPGIFSLRSRSQPGLYHFLLKGEGYMMEEPSVQRVPLCFDNLVIRINVSTLSILHNTWKELFSMEVNATIFSSHLDLCSAG